MAESYNTISLLAKGSHLEPILAIVGVGMQCVHVSRIVVSLYCVPLHFSEFSCTHMLVRVCVCARGECPVMEHLSAVVMHPHYSPCPTPHLPTPPHTPPHPTPPLSCDRHSRPTGPPAPLWGCPRHFPCHLQPWLLLKKKPRKSFTLVPTTTTSSSQWRGAAPGGWPFTSRPAIAFVSQWLMAIRLAPTPTMGHLVKFYSGGVPRLCCIRWWCMITNNRHTGGDGGAGCGGGPGLLMHTGASQANCYEAHGERIALKLMCQRFGPFGNQACKKCWFS